MKHNDDGPKIPMSFRLQNWASRPHSCLISFATNTTFTHCGFHSINMEKGGGDYFNTVGKLTCAPLAGGHTPREGGSLGTGVWREQGGDLTPQSRGIDPSRLGCGAAGARGGVSHPSSEGLHPSGLGCKVPPLVPAAPHPSPEAGSPLSRGVPSCKGCRGQFP